MSALGLAALGMASRTAQLQPALYAELANRSPAADVLTLESGGYGEAGKGAARYVADALASAALAAAHPRFAFRTANDRYFRLMPDAGAFSVEQGGATGNGVADDRDAIQDAIDYAEAIATRELRFEGAHYRIHCPLRSSPAEDMRAEDGRPLIVRSSLTMRGCAAARTVLDFRAHGGADPDDSWQVVATSASDPSPAVWRGGGLYLQGDATRPDPAVRKIARLELDRLVFQGNRSRTAETAYPANVSTGDGWDVTDRAFWLQDIYVGEVVVSDTDFIGWRGELFYAVGDDDAIERIAMTRCRLLTGNGNAFNLGCDPVVWAEDCEFGDCKIAQEDTGKREGHFRNCLWRDCEFVWIGGGSTNGRFYTYKYPTRDNLAPVPATQFDNCRFEDCGIVWVNSWVSGRIRTVDTVVALGSYHGFALRDVDLEIDAWLDRANGIHALALYGPDTLTQPVEDAPAGVWQLPPRGIRLKVRHFRSALAQQNAREWLGVLWTGYIDRSCRIEVDGEAGNGRSPNGLADPLSFPFVNFGGGNASTAWTAHGYYEVPALSASGPLSPAGPMMAVQVAGENAVAVTLPGVPRGGADYGYADGQTLRIVKQYDAGSITFAKGAAVSMAMVATRVLDKAFDWIELRYNRTLTRWEETGFGAYG